MFAEATLLSAGRIMDVNHNRPPPPQKKGRKKKIKNLSLMSEMG